MLVQSQDTGEALYRQITSFHDFTQALDLVMYLRQITNLESDLLAIKVCFELIDSQDLVGLATIHVEHVQMQHGILLD